MRQMTNQIEMNKCNILIISIGITLFVFGCINFFVKNNNRYQSPVQDPNIPIPVIYDVGYSESLA